MAAILSWINGLNISQAIRASHSMFMTIHVLHGFAIFFAVILILKVDLRLMGIAERRTPVTELLAETLPWTWCLFVLAAITGLLMFASKAPSFYDNEFFRLKILFVGLAGINMALFHAFTLRGVAQWDSDVPPVFAAKVAGGLSIVSWIAVIAFGFETLFTV